MIKFTYQVTIIYVNIKKGSRREGGKNNTETREMSNDQILNPFKELCILDGSNSILLSFYK